MSKDIRIAIAGVGNCCCSLVQGIFYYSDVRDNNEVIPGLMHNVLGGYSLSSMKPVAAFDIDARKVGRDLSDAIFAKPNCTTVFQKDIPNLGIDVQMAPVLDGVAAHMSDFPEDRGFRPSKENPLDIRKALEDSGAEILVNYLPVGSEEAVCHYARACLDAGVAMVNCMPVFISSNAGWENRFSEKRIPIIGDDVKSQVGATITHRVLAKMFSDRGVKIDRTYQLNTGGNTDFLNMLERSRLKSKKVSKTESVQSQLPVPLHPDNIHIGPSDYVPWQNDNKICFIRIEGRKFGNVPINLEARLSVEDSPNSAGVTIDAIRCARLALDREIGGELTSISAYTMKHPAHQYPDTVARQMVEEFIRGERER